MKIKSSVQSTVMNKWTEMTVMDGNGVEYLVQMVKFDEPSEYGIDGGKISKLFVRSTDKKILANYDRGWDVIPASENAQNIVNEIVAEYN